LHAFTVAVTLTVVAVGSPCARAHDIPNAQVDRAIQVTIEPGRLRVDYEVSLAELTLVQDLRALIGTLPRTDRTELFNRYGRETGPLNAKGILATFDGRPLELQMRSFDLAVEEHPRYTFHFECELGRNGRLSLRDTNYVASEGTSRLALQSTGNLTVRGYDGPSIISEAPIKPVWQLTDEEERRTKQVDVEVGPARIAVAPNRAMVSAPPHRPQQPSNESLAALLSRASRTSLWALWLVALGLGGAHAIQPGHGKTIVAVGADGSSRRSGQGVLLALILTLTHTGSVLAVAAIVWLTRSTRYGDINAALAQIAGFAIAAVGVWRLGRSLGKFDDASQVAERMPLKRQGIIALGVSGGLVPCWDAILLVLEAEFLGQLLLGLFLLSAFSLGMALVLVAIAFGSARILRIVQGRDTLGIWARRINLLSGIALAGIGLYLLFR
jgi:ABC-type nickel/cobalt efflux system permease component RcnA